MGYNEAEKQKRKEERRNNKKRKKGVGEGERASEIVETLDVVFPRVHSLPPPKTPAKKKNIFLKHGNIEVDHYTQRNGLFNTVKEKEKENAKQSEIYYKRV